MVMIFGPTDDLQVTSAAIQTTLKRAERVMFGQPADPYGRIRAPRRPRLNTTDAEVAQPSNDRLRTERATESALRFHEAADFPLAVSTGPSETGWP